MASAAASASLEKGLGQRSSASELLDRGVLKQGGVANSKVGAAKMLEEKMLKLTLEKKLGDDLRSGEWRPRPSPASPPPPRRRHPLLTC